MNGGMAAYYSGSQTTVALCTAMAETIALAKLVVQVKHMRALFLYLMLSGTRNTNQQHMWGC